MPSLQLENANDIIDVMCNIKEVNLLYDEDNCLYYISYI